MASAALDLPGESGDLRRACRPAGTASLRGDPRRLLTNGRKRLARPLGLVELGQRRAGPHRIVPEVRRGGRGHDRRPAGRHAPPVVLSAGLIDLGGQLVEPALQRLDRGFRRRAIEGIGQPHRRQLLLPTGSVVANRHDTDAVASGENLDHPRARGRGRLGEDVRERPEDDPFDGAFQGAGAVARVVADAGKEIDDGPIDIDLEAAPRDPAAEEDGANFALRQLSDVGPIERIEDDDPAEPVDELRPEELPYRLPDPVLGRRRRGLDKPESTRRRLPRAQIAREDDD